MVMGFPSRFSGLSFEFAWQHPHRARLCSVKMQPFKKTKGLGAANSVKRKLLQLKILLSVCKPFCQFPVTVNFLKEEDLSFFLSDTSLPEHISCTLGPVDDAYQIAREVYDSVNTMDELDNACIVCDRVFCTGRSVLVCKNYSDRCSLLVHPTCLAQIFLSYVSGPSLIPDTGNCPICSETLRWADLVKTAKQM